ncbi:prenyltransferase [Alicycliphilus denitrificans]|uniref:prenyltransferase n=1 Tax=Alicycliphilus denitrificans TaxID=179636 RepID=UPI003A7FAF55
MPLPPVPSALPSPPASPNWRTLLRMTRPGSLLLTVAACLLGMAFALACGCGFDPLRAAATLALAVTAHAGANVLNDYHDALSGADAANQEGLFPFSGGSRLIQQGLVSEADTARWAAVLLLLLVVPAGLLLALHSGGGLVLIGVAGLFLAWAYSAPPLALMARGLGEVAVALAWWLVVLGADYVQRRQFFVIPAATAASFALLAANILLANGFPDAAADARVGKKTLVVRLGARRAAWAYLLIALLAHGWLALAVWLLIPPARALWGLASLPLSLAASALLLRHAGQPQRLRPAIVLTIAAALVHALAIAAALASMAR